MQIKSVTVGLSLTESLPDYCNVRPSLTITADLLPTDRLDNVIESLDEIVRIYVEGRADDALETAGQSPKYYTGPLYRLFYWHQRNALVILPASGTIPDLPGNWTWRSPDKMRLSTLHRIAAQESADDNLPVLDCPTIADLLAWWESQTFYVAYGLRDWHIDGRDWYLAHVLFIRHDLKRPLELMLLDNTLRTLDGYIHHHFPERVNPDKWTVVDDQYTLDHLVADWTTAYPRP